MKDAFIVSAVRIPTGKFLGALKDIPAPELGAMVVRESVKRAGIDPASVDFPTPLGPTTATIRPLGISSVTPSRTRSPP